MDRQDEVDLQGGERQEVIAWREQKQVMEQDERTEEEFKVRDNSNGNGRNHVIFARENIVLCNS